MRSFLFFISLFLFSVVSLRGETIYEMIQKGKLKEANDSLSVLMTASNRNGDVLFFRSMIVANADESARLMEAALNAAVSNQFKQEIYYRLCLYYFHTGNNNRFSEIVNSYRSTWESGKYSYEITRLAIAVDIANRHYETALRQIDGSLLKNSHDSVRQLGEIDKARLMAAFNKQVGAEKLLRKLSRENSGPGVAMALYILAEQAIEKRRTDDAVFYYNILREGYANSVGLDALIEKMSFLPDDASNSAADELTGTYYSIQVGVFSRKDNANRQADRFKQHNKKVDIRGKEVAGKNYHVVYVGHFKTYWEASEFKTTLESIFGETFQVVAR